MADSKQDTLVDDAFAAFEEGDLEAAVAYGRRALAIDKDDPDANHVVGEALLELGDAHGAIPFLENAVDGDEENIDALVALGTASFESLNLVKAKSLLTLATELEPTHADAWWSLGLTVERQGNDDRASKHFREATRLDREAFPPSPSVSEEEFREMVESAIGDLPADFRSQLENLAIVVERLPDDSTLSGDPPFSPTILGLHVGPPQPGRGGGAPSGPNTIFLFQKNIERAASSHDELVEQIEVTLLHEIGHYLGLDEDDVEDRGLE